MCVNAIHADSVDDDPPQRRGLSQGGVIMVSWRSINCEWSQASSACFF
jgi:hypothetical protein